MYQSKHVMQKSIYNLAEIVTCCRRCAFDMDDGDIFERIGSNLQVAKLYGWSTDNPKRFSKEVTIQPWNSPQFQMCPQCRLKWPLSTNKPIESHVYVHSNEVT